MTKHNAKRLAKPGMETVSGWVLLALAISGFAQMPIFKRYYIADIPGLGWLAQFWVTHYMHYLGAVLFIAMATYFFSAYLLFGRSDYKITVSGYVRTGLLSGIIATGVFLVIRNFPGIHMQPQWIMFLDLAHMVMAMIFLSVTAGCFVLKKRWTIRIEHPKKEKK